MPITLPALLPIDRLTLVQMSEASPGSLLIKSAGYGGEPFLTFRDANDPEPRTYVLPFEGDDRYRFHIADAVGNSGHWLAIDSWQLLVDPASAFMGTRESPEVGDAFVSAGASGFVGRWNHAEAYISVAGAVLEQPAWTSSFVGYRSWAICIDHGAPGTPHILLDRSRPPRT